MRGTMMAECGHVTPIEFDAEVMGEPHHMKLKRADKAPPFCRECFIEGAIVCPWCGKPITYGDPITLYTPMKKDFKIPEGAVVFQENPLQLVGCLRIGCADTGADRAGFWQYPGKVYRVLSPLELCMQTNEAVVATNVSSPDGKMAVFPRSDI